MEFVDIIAMMFINAHNALFVHNAIKSQTVINYFF